MLARLLNRPFCGDEEEFSDSGLNTVRIVDNRIYSAKVLRVNYTTYDIRRDQDSMNPRTNADVMVLSPETGPGAHPYWYAHVLGVFHARVLHTGPLATNRSIQHMEFLWVRWFGVDPGHRYGHKVARLPKIGFVPESDPLAFGFLDPSLVLRGCHLIPAFNDGRTSDLLTAALTAARPPDEFEDWVAFYVNMYVKIFRPPVCNPTHNIMIVKFCRSRYVHAPYWRRCRPQFRQHEARDRGGYCYQRWPRR